VRGRKTVAKWQPSLAFGLCGARLGNTQRVCYAIAGICSLLLATGCGRSENINPGEADYPTENSHPTRTIHLAGLLSPNVPLRIEVFSVAERGGLNDTSDCSFLPNARGPTPFSIQEPVKVTRSDDGYTADVALDKYIPGRCRWKLESISYWVGGSEIDDPSRQNPDAYVYVDQRQMINSLDAAEDLKQEFECVGKDQGGEQIGRYTCITDDPAHKTLHLNAGTKSVTINFRGGDAHLSALTNAGFR
jgi:hypothetical protein